MVSVVFVTDAREISNSTVGRTFDRYKGPEMSEMKSTIRSSYRGYQISQDVARGFRVICKALQRRMEHEAYAAMLAWLDLPMSIKQQTAVESSTPRCRQGASLVHMAREYMMAFKQACQAHGFPTRAGMGGALLNWIRMDESVRAQYRQRVTELKISCIHNNPLLPPQGEPNHVQAG